MKITLISYGVLALGTYVAFTLAQPAAAQTLEAGDHIVTLHYSALDREDQGVSRDATTAMVSYGYQYTDKLRLLGFFGQSRTDNTFPPDTQTTRTPTFGLGAQYQVGRGGTLTGTILSGDIAEAYTSGGTTTAGDGDTLTATLQYEQVAPLSGRTFVKGLAAASHTNSSFDTSGLSNKTNTNRFTVGAELFHIAGDNWIFTAGLSHTWSNAIITITDKEELNRARLSATYRFTEDFGATLGWTQAFGAEDTHRRLDLSFTHRF
ncbi:hypothetical protein [uncultured Shimia sp.]|uniref:hypothetical protein n=1 Tax=uncultured Shimia sp. TaxID=573152 RepID=UPI0026213A9D|nr:hypothetical protein [uncultured Shimia sp.]